MFSSKSRAVGLGTPRLTLNLNSLNLLSLLWTFKMHLKKKMQVVMLQWASYVFASLLAGLNEECMLGI